MKYLKTYLIIFVLFLLRITSVNGQFTYYYVADTTISLGQDCKAAFELTPNPPLVVLSTLPFVSIVSLTMDSLLTGHNFGDTIVGISVINMTYIVVNSNGDRDTTVYPIYFEDATAPEITNFVNDTIISCIDTLPVPLLTDFVLLDNCDLNPTLVYLGEVTNQITCIGARNISRRWSVSDVDNNTNIFTQFIQIIDTIPPVFNNVPNDTIVGCNNMPPFAFPGLDGFDLYDECGSISNLLYNESDNTCIGGYLTLIKSWTAVDNCGNSNTVTQEIILVDTIGPTFDTPLDVSIDCQYFGTDTIIGTPINVMDNCDVAPIVSHSDIVSFNSCPNSQIITRTWTVTDACGNSISDDQVISIVDNTNPVFDQIPQDTFAFCQDTSLINQLFNTWITNHGNALVSDNCDAPSDLNWFAFNHGTILSPSLDLNTCNNQTPGVFTSQAIDFLVVDRCLNQSIISTATFYVNDTIAPVLLCSDDTLIYTNLSACQSLYNINPPIEFENCNKIDSFVSVDALNLPIVISSTDPNNADVVVESKDFSFSVPLSEEVFVQDNPIIQILISNIDGEGALEYFNILSETGQLVGQTNPNNGACGSSLTTISLDANDFNYWAQDGNVSFTLEPNIPSLNSLPDSLGINDVCGGTTFIAHINYLGYKSGATFDHQYMINNAPWISYNPQSNTSFYLDQGLNELNFKTVDCSGNIGQCDLQINVVDIESPDIICPVIPTYSILNNCDTNIVIETPEIYTDNCELSTFQYNSPIHQFSFSQFGTNGFIADDINNTVINCLGPATSYAELNVYTHADINTTGEFFIVYVEGQRLDQALHVLNPVFGNTGLGTGCNTNGFEKFSFYIPQDSLNHWIDLNGNIDISVIPNRDTSNYSNFVSPCHAFPPNTADETTGAIGENEIYFEFNYQYAKLSYYIVDATSNNLVSPQSTFNPPNYSESVLLNVGEYNLHYIISDASGNKDTCVTPLLLNDNQAPVAICDTIEIFVNPDGSANSSLNANILDLNSSDNCGIDSFYTNSLNFNCDDVNLDTIVNLVVMDPSGNIDSCGALVKVRMLTFQPSFQLGLCLNDTVRLFANAPIGVFTYEWTTPQNIVFSNLENPVLLNLDMSDSGLYTVEITGPTGCVMSNSIFINIMSTSNTPTIMVLEDTICQGELLELQTTTISGTNVNYNWFIIDPNGNLAVSSTDTSFFSFVPSLFGDYEFYLRVQLDGCNSSSSMHLFAQVKQRPSASVNDPLLLLCEEDSLYLGSSSFSIDLAYEWSNPNGNIFSTIQNPLPFEVSTINFSGAYNLTTILNSCRSQEATTEVLVSEIPATPGIISPSLVCEGDTLTLITTVLNADIYYWVNPQNDTIISVTNDLFINDVSQDDNGWYVFIKINNCYSENSVLFENFLVPSPLAIPQLPNALCDGDSLNLLAEFEPNTSYFWTTPQNDTIAGTSITIFAEDGIYCVNATNTNGCVTENCTSVNLLNTPQVTSISQDGNNCVTIEDTINFIPTVFPINSGNYNFNWQGPSFTNSSEIASIPLVQEENNGLYYLIVTDGICASDSFEIELNVSDIPLVSGSITLHNSDNSLCIGDTLKLEINPSIIDNVTYIWSGPNGDDTTDVSHYNLVDVNLDDAGSYTVYIDNKGCISQAYTSVSIEVFDYPEIPDISAISPICENSSLALELNTNYTNADFLWTGPNLNTIVPEPVINEATLLDMGVYYLDVNQNGCNTTSEPLNVIINPELMQPEISANSPLCREAFESLDLIISPSSYAYDALYTWTLGNGNTLNILQDDSLSVFDVSLLPTGFFTVSVNGLRGECVVNSNPITVLLDTIPTEVVQLCQDEVYVCPEDTLLLCANQNVLGQGQWLQIIAGEEPFLNIDDNLQAQTFVESLPFGYQFSFEYTISNSGCGVYSRETLAVLSKGLVAPADAGEDVEKCDATVLSIVGNLPAGNIDGEWNQSTSQANQGILIDLPNESETTISGTNFNETYMFIWGIDNLDCPEFSRDTVLVTNYSIPEIQSFAGEDLVVCSAESQLGAEVPSIGNGSWIALDENVIIQDISNPNTQVTNLLPGVNKFLWTLSNGACSDYSSDLINVFYLESSLAQDDFYDIQEGEEFGFNVLDNDALSGEFTITFTEPEHGLLSSSTPGNFTFLPHSTYNGDDGFQYIICSEECPNQCSEATVNFSITASSDCTIPTIFSPNNDGINDYFVIPCLISNNFEENELTILNQWGDIVYHASPYYNDWDGTKDGILLPISTYFFILKFSNDIPSENGFLMLER